MRVLLVEDDPRTLQALADFLEGVGYTVLATGEYRVARSCILEKHFDVLITDVRLGPFNGLGLAVLARQLLPNLRIVVVSGFDDPVLEAEARTLGAPFFLKPLDLPRLMDHLAGDAPTRARL